MLPALPIVSFLMLFGTTPTSNATNVDVFQGSYDPVEPKKQALKVGAAVDKSLASMNVLVRWRAGSILRDHNPIAPEITISVRDGKVLVMTPLRSPWWTELDAKPLPITTRRGRKAVLTRRFESPYLVERFVSERGKRRHRIHLSKDGKVMHWQVTVDSEELPTPIRYTLRYRRRN